MTIVDMYSSSTSEAAQNSDSSQSTTAQTQYILRAHVCPSCPVIWLHNRAGAMEAWAVISVRDKGDLDLRLHLSRVRETMLVPEQATCWRQPRPLFVANTN